MSALAGEVANPQTYNDDVRKLVRRAARTTTSSTTTTTEIGVLRLDGVPVKAGRSYLILAGHLMLSSSVNNDGIVARFRMTTDGSTVVVGSTQRAELRLQTLDSQGQAAAPMGFTYYPAADEELSIWLGVIRISGTGNVSISVINGLISFEVYDTGPDPGNTGVSL